MKLGRTLWKEDDATTRDPDHEGLPTAWERLFGEPYDRKKAVEIEDEDSDEELIRFPSGAVALSSYPGNNAIYAAPAHIPEGRIRCLYVPVDGEPVVEFVTTVESALLFSEYHLYKKFFNGSVHRIWSINPDRHPGYVGRDTREIHTSRKAVLGHHVHYPRGSFYVFGEDNGSVDEDSLAVLLERFKRTAEERVLDAVREFHVANPFLCMKQRMELHDATSAWLKENP